MTVSPMRNWISFLRLSSGQASTTTLNTVWVKNWTQRIEIVKIKNKNVDRVVMIII
jgi:hypothetical protein